MAREHPSAVFDGLLIWSASFLTAPPTIFHVVSACSASVLPNTIVADASPRFSPVLSISNGRHGSGETAFREEKPATTNLLRQSVPLTIT